MGLCRFGRPQVSRPAALVKEGNLGLMKRANVAGVVA